jgi:hypothetical protein
MIARIWHGYTKPEHADAYEAMLKPEVLPGISKAKATGTVICSEKRLGTRSSSSQSCSGDSIDAIRAVAGPDYEAAVIPEERRK